jgi:hypothetical protein
VFNSIVLALIKKGFGMERTRLLALYHLVAGLEAVKRMAELTATPIARTHIQKAADDYQILKVLGQKVLSRRK